MFLIKREANQIEKADLLKMLDFFVGSISEENITNKETNWIHTKLDHYSDNCQTTQLATFYIWLSRKWG